MKQKEQYYIQIMDEKNSMWMKIWKIKQKAKKEVWIGPLSHLIPSLSPNPMNFLLIPNLGGLGRRFEFLAMGLEPTTPPPPWSHPYIYFVYHCSWNCQVMQHNNNKMQIWDGWQWRGMPFPPLLLVANDVQAWDLWTLANGCGGSVHHATTTIFIVFPIHKLRT